MAILVNWFEATFDKKQFDLPYLDADAWEDSTPILDRYPNFEAVRVRREDRFIRIYFITGSPEGNFETEAVASSGPRGVLARIIEYNLKRHFEASGLTVTSSRWGVDATREVQRVKEIGLSIR